MLKRPDSHNGMIKALTRDYYIAYIDAFFPKNLVHMTDENRLVLINSNDWECAWRN